MREILKTASAAGLLLLLMSGYCLSAQKAVIQTSEEQELKVSATLGNLMTAYNGELNAREKYLAFAAKAEEEGFLKAAQLFKAAALSKEVHAAKRAELIKSLGDTPKADIRKQTVRSTKENIAEAIKLENYETASLYPGFLSQAGKDDIRGAVLGFNSAIKVGAGRKKLFIEAQNNLASWKQPSAGFYVCRVCGNLVKTIDFEYCPICKVPSSEFTTVK